MQEEEIWDGDPNTMPETYIDESKDAPEGFDGVPLITSNRTFGVELEMFGGKEKPVQTFCREKGHIFDRDGSIRDTTGQGICREVASKIFTGMQGAKELLELTEACKSAGFACNYSTGTHVHLDAKDYYNKDTFKTFKLSELSKINGTHDVIIVETPLFNAMRRSMSLDRIMNRYVTEGFLSARGKGIHTTHYTMEDGKTSNICIVPCTYLGNRYLLMVRLSSLQDQLNIKPSKIARGDQNLILTDESTTLSMDKYGREYATLSVGKVLIFGKESNKRWEDLKTLFAFYTFFDDVLFGMLPPSRKNSVYCRPLSENYLLSQVIKTNNQVDIEKIWYGSDDIGDIQHMKEERKHNSRRSAINLHSIFGDHNTLEIRSHHGTLNGQSLLGWIALHQRIMDSIKENRFDWDTIRSIKKTKGIQAKLGYMFSLIGASEELQAFVKSRLQTYSKIIL